jgi:hypothetical protein
MNITLTAILALVLSLGANLYQWRDYAVTVEKIKGDQQTAVQAAEAKAQKAARDAEAASALASNAAGEAYEKGKRDAEATAKQFVTDLGADVVELRNRWKGCLASRVPAPSAAGVQPDAATDDQRESLGRIAANMGRARGAAGAAEAQIVGLQRYIRTVCLAPPAEALH